MFKEKKKGEARAALVEPKMLIANCQLLNQ